MIAIERHVVEAKDTSICLFTESKGAVGGGRLIRHVASSLENNSRKASFVVVPQLDNKRGFPQSFIDGASVSIVEHGELKDMGMAEAVLQVVREDCQRAPDVNLRVIVLENATDLALSYCMASVVVLLRECKASTAVHSVLALFQQQAHPAAQLNAIRSIQTCNVDLQPVRPLQADRIYTSHGQRVHVEMVVSLLRHSGRVRVEKQLFSMTSLGDLKPCSVKPSTLGDGLLESTSSAARRTVQEEQEALSQRRIQSKYEKEMSGFMKLTLSDEEKERKANIVLPWQHEGEHRQQETLQKEAADTGEASIIYFRDSDQDYDSDEDPDDDLDL